MSKTDEIIAGTAPKQLVVHNLIDRRVEELCNGMVLYEKRPAKRRDGTLCEPFSVQKAARLGIIGDLVPALKINGKSLANLTAVTEQMLDEYGRIIHGEFKSGTAFKKSHALIKKGEIDLGLLDQKVEEMCAKLPDTFPECMTKSLEELRKPNLQAWNLNKGNSRARLAPDMMNEARTCFRALNAGPEKSVAKSTLSNLARPWLTGFAGPRNRSRAGCRIRRNDKETG